MEKNGSFLDILRAALLLPGLHAMSDTGPERGEGRRAGGGTATSQSMKSPGKMEMIL